MVPGLATSMPKRRREPAVLDRKYWYLYLKYKILEKLNSFETDRDMDDERVDDDYVSEKLQEVEEKLEATREEWKEEWKKLGLEYDSDITLVSSEYAEDLEDRIERAFSKQSDDYGQDDDYDTDMVVDTLIKMIIKDTDVDQDEN